jgi:hypothetical protein
MPKPKLLTRFAETHVSFIEKELQVNPVTRVLPGLVPQADYVTWLQTTRRRQYAFETPASVPSLTSPTGSSTGGASRRSVCRLDGLEVISI